MTPIGMNRKYCTPLRNGTQAMERPLAHEAQHPEPNGVRDLHFHKKLAYIMHAWLGSAKFRHDFRQNHRIYV